MGNPDPLNQPWSKDIELYWGLHFRPQQFHYPRIALAFTDGGLAIRWIRAHELGLCISLLKSKIKRIKAAIFPLASYQVPTLKTSFP